MSLVVVRAAGLVTIQDLGRPGRMHEALAPGGALVPELLVAANRAVRNSDNAPALEVLGRLVLRAELDIVVATTAPGSIPREQLVSAGSELVVASEPRRVAYLAIRGGVAAPLVLGGRGTQLSAGIGAPLRAGDRITADNVGWNAAFPSPMSASPIAASPMAAAPFFDGDIVRVIAGPDQEAFASGALAQLVAAAYQISPASDRVGTRLDGPTIARRAGETGSRPMVRGAVEVPADGRPIVLGPEHPTTGGYPILAVVAHADLGRFFAIRLGGRVRFEIAT